MNTDVSNAVVVKTIYLFRRMTYRLYTLSIAAIRRPKEPNTEGFIGHQSVVCIRPSLEEAGRQSKELAYRLFPVIDGYTNHSSVVSPVEADFVDEIFVAVGDGRFSRFANPIESVRTFNFDPDTPTDFYFEMSGQIH